MNLRLFKFLFLLLFCAACKVEEPVSPSDDPVVESYVYSNKADVSTKFKLKAGDKNVTVLKGKEADLAIFGASGEVDVEVQLMTGVSSELTVRPVSKKYPHQFSLRTLHLKLKSGDRVVIDMPKPKGQEYRPTYASKVVDSLDKLFIFVNPLEVVEASNAQIDSRTLFFASGRIHDAGELKLSESQNRIYIQGGAIVKGWMKLRNRNNVTIEGCGILDASEWDGETRTPKRNPIYNAYCSGMTVKNLTVLNEDYWTAYFVECNGLNLKNVKVVASASHLANGNGCENDAYDICSSRNVTVEGCFGYAHDDVFCLKTSAALVPSGNIKNVSFKDCIAWNYDSGNSYEIGYGTVGTCEDIHYEDIYSVHSGKRASSYFRRGGIAIHVAEEGVVKNVSYNNVYIEDPREHNFYFGVFKTPYEKTEWAPGKLENVNVTNLNILKKAPEHGIVVGYDATHKTSGVHFKNYFLTGKKVSSLSDADLSETGYSENLTFE